MEITRRGFIGKASIAATCFAGSGLLLHSCSGIRRVDLNPPGRKYEPIPNLSDDSAEILYYASLAPSGHNAQPWYVRVADENTWIIGSDPQYWLPAVDPENREALLSIGAFAENLSIAAGAKGYETVMEIMTDNPLDEQVIKVSLQKSNPRGYPLERLVARRKVKNGHRPTELKGDDVKFLSESLEDHLFYFPRESDHAKCITEGTIEAFRAQAYRDDAQAELAEWIRFSNREAKAHRNGMTTESMEIAGLAGWYVRNFMDKADVMKKSFREQGIKGMTEAAHEGAGWLIITSKGKGVADLIEAGRRFERMWLLARERMIAIHPMTQMLEEKMWRDEVASQHGPEIIPQFILRVGYLDTYPDPVSLRKPVSWFLQT
jgi:nitroreductase